MYIKLGHATSASQRKSTVTGGAGLAQELSTVALFPSQTQAPPRLIFKTLSQRITDLHSLNYSSNLGS